MTQEELGDILGLAYQQVQKYERGTNRISASRLFKLSQVLDVSVEYFFDDMPLEVAATSPATKQRGRAQEPASCEPNPMAEGEMLELVHAYYKIEDAKIRKRLLEMTKALGAAASVDG